MSNGAARLKTYSGKERNAYLIGMFGQNIIFNIMIVFTSYYLQNVLLIPAAIVGVLLAVAQIWDAVNDPIMGTVVDRTRTKWGKCRPWLMFSPPVILAVTVLCFLNGTYDAQGSPGRNAFVVAWAAFFYIAWGMSYTTGDIPLWGVTVLMTEDEKDRNKLQTLARLVAGVGAAVCMIGFQPLALAVGQALLKKEAAAGFGIDLAALTGQAEAAGTGLAELAARAGFLDYAARAAATERTGFIIVALIFAVLGCATFQLVGICVREKIPPSQKVNSVGENFKTMWRNQPFRQLLLSGIVSAPRNIIMTIAMTLVSYYFASKDPLMAIVYIGLIGGGLFLGMFGAMTMVPRLMERYNKKTLYNFSNILEIIPNVTLFGLYLISTRVSGGLTAVYLLIPSMLTFAVKGICLGLFSPLQTAMISDAVDYEDYTNHVRPDGVFFSGQTFMTKIGNGLSSIIYTSLCALVGFSDRNIGMVNELISDNQIPRDMMLRGSGETVIETLTRGDIFNFFTMMFFAISIVPAIANVLALIPMRKYSLDKKTYKTVLEELQRRRREEEDETAAV